MSSPSCLPAVVLVSALVPTAFAQVNNPWVTFVKDTNRIQNPDGSVAAQVTSDVDEKDYTWVDVNHDGWTDLIVMRKTMASTTGKRTNQLLMNDNGILVDRTSQYVTETDIPGDFGFNTATNDRDVQCVDLDGDGWEDIVTATTLSDGDPKHISHPRIYRNKGLVGGVWQGFRHEEARIPQLYTDGGLAVAPRFCSVSAGDVTGDGFPDLYFADYDGAGESSSADLNDKLLINDGFGFFTDSGTTRMTAPMLKSAFGMASEILDMNGDGLKDVVKCSGLGSPTGVFVSYNDPGNVGHFVISHLAAAGSTYHVDVGDLNADGRLDLIVSDDGDDFVKYNTGTDALGRAIFGPHRTYSFVSTADDDGFAGTNLAVDLDGDGFLDTIHADVDVDVPGCSRRAHIYHNLGGAIGSQMTLREEAEFTNGTGWKGAVGLVADDLRGTFDMAVFDIDDDGDLDMILGRCTGTQVWMNQRYQPGAWTVYCAGDGSGTACPCGNDSAVGQGEGCLNSLGTGGKLVATGSSHITNDTFVLTGSGMPSSSALYFQGDVQAGAGAGAAFGDGLRCVAGAVVRLGPVTNVAGGSAWPGPGDPAISVKGMVPSGATRNYQVWYRNAAAFCAPSTFNLTNGVSVVWQP